MAILTDNERVDIWAKFMKEISAVNESISIGKSDLRASVNAIDQWIDDNMTAFNAALPIEGRDNLTAKQKAGLLMYVLNKRYEVM